MSDSHLTGDAKEYFEKIEEMLDSWDYEFAEETLMSIGEWVEENNHITEKQKKAVDNIEESIR